MASVLEARNLNKSFGAVTAAADINVRVEQDSVVGLIGSNGAGKTTFINMVTGYLEPTSGSIHYLDRDITGLSPRVITGLGICRSFQIPQLFNTLSVSDNLMVGVGIAARSGRAVGSARGSEEQKVEALIERFNLAGYRGQAAGLLPKMGGAAGAMQEQLRQLGARQRALAEELEKLRGGGQMPGAGEMADEAQDLARRLEAQRLDRETVQRQEQLFRREE